MSWIWWNSISGSTIRPTDWPANRTPAIGRPLARLFFEPQNTMVIASARSKPEPAADAGGGQQHRAQQRRVDQQQRRQLRRVHLVPDAVRHALAERGIDHQQDRAAIDQAEQRPVARGPGADPRPRKLAGGERQQKLQHDVADAVRREPALGAQQQPGQQRRQHDAEQVGGGGGAQRRRHVAAGDRGEGDRRLHGRGQHAQQQQRRSTAAGSADAGATARGGQAEQRGTARRCWRRPRRAAASAARRPVPPAAPGGRLAGRTSARSRPWWRRRRATAPPPCAGSSVASADHAERSRGCRGRWRGGRAGLVHGGGSSAVPVGRKVARRTVIVKHG